MRETRLCPAAAGNRKRPHLPEVVIRHNNQLSLELKGSAHGERSENSQLALAASQEQLHQTQNELKRAKRALEMASRTRSEVLSILSHELRTPMNGISGLAHLLNSSDPREEQRDYLNGIKASADNLLNLINNLTDFLLLESKDMTLERVEFSPGQVIRQALAPFEEQLQAKGLEYREEIPADLPEKVVGDPLRLKQILACLMGNALKFTEQGVVRFTVSAVREQNRVLLHCCVADSGIGIPNHLREQVFRPFARVDSSTTRRFGGAGLGLTLSRQLAELMGGSVRVEQSSAPGTLFLLSLPFALPIARKKQPPPGPQRSLLHWEGRSLHILLAEDHPSNRNLTVTILKKLGHTVVPAENGKVALEASARESFDLILMDVEMPEMDGWEATSRIRERERGGGRRVPIIALTAHAIQGKRETLRRAGFDGYIAKPIDFMELCNEMRRLAGAAPVAA